jgi:hypothetical protein
VDLVKSRWKNDFDNREKVFDFEIEEVHLGVLVRKMGKTRGENSEQEGQFLPLVEVNRKNSEQAARQPQILLLW